MAIILFKNVRNVIMAEKILLKDKIFATVRPVPSKLSSECGMCLEVNIRDIDKLRRLLSESNISYKIVEL